jgi:hypothetical protein
MGSSVFLAPPKQSGAGDVWPGEARETWGLWGVSPVGQFHCWLPHPAIPIKLMIIIKTI